MCLSTRCSVPFLWKEEGEFGGECESDVWPCVCGGNEMDNASSNWVCRLLHFVNHQQLSMSGWSVRWKSDDVMSCFFLLVGRGAARQAVRSFSFYVIVCWIFYSVNLIKAVLQLSWVGGSKSSDENHCFHWCLLCDTVTSSCGCFWTSFSVLLSSIDKLPVGWNLRSLFFFWHCLCPHIIQDLLG